MAETPRAGTGDFACRSWRYWSSIVLMRPGNLSITGTFLIRLLPCPIIEDISNMQSESDHDYRGREQSDLHFLDWLSGKGAIWSWISATCTIQASFQIVEKLCSCAREIFPRFALFWSARSLFLIIMDNSPNMHNTGFFSNSYLLSITYGSIWIQYPARYLEIFKKPNFQVVKYKSMFIWKMLSQAELETEGLRFMAIFGLPPSPRWRGKTRVIPDLSENLILRVIWYCV